MTSRYSVDPARLKGQKDIVEHIIEVVGRVSEGETGLRAGHTAIEDGSLTIRNGDLIVSETEGDVVLRILHGGIPEIRMWPLGDTDTHRIALFGYDDVNGGQAVALTIETSPGAAQDGGKLLLTKNYSVLSYQPATGEETYLWLNGDPVTPEIAIFRGKWADQTQYNAHQGIYVGSFVASSGFSTWTHTYFTPFATSMIPVCTVLHAGSTIQWVLESFSTSAFTVRFSSTTNDKTINFWAFRI